MPTNNKGVNMATGEFAKPIYDLLEELGDSEEGLGLILGDLVKYMSGDQIKDFVSDFRRNHDMDCDEDEWVDDIVEKKALTEEDVESLADWASTILKEEDEKKIASYFSSQIPEC